MPYYAYKVKDSTGRVLYGLLEGQNKKDIKNKLSNYEFFYISAEPCNKKKLTQKKANLQTLLMFTHRLSSLIEAGLPILLSMNILWKQTEDKTIQLILSYMKIQLEEGNRISESMDEFPNIFPKVYRALIRVAEMSAALVSVLRRLTEYLEYQSQIIARTKRAIMYPSIVVVFSILVVIGMFTFVVPTFSKILLRLDVELPFLTKVILAVSEGMRSWAFVSTAVLIFLGCYILMQQVKKRPNLGYQWDKFIYKIPYFGNIIFLIALSRFTRSLNILLEAGVPILESIEIAKSTAENQLILDNIQKIKVEVEEGQSLYLAFKQADVFPVMMIEMIGVGESSGSLIKVLEKLTKHFDEEIDYDINKFLTFLEPCLIVLIGFIVIITLLAIYLPIFAIWQGITY